MNKMRLSTIELAILSEIEFADVISPATIARRLKMRTHTVQRALSRLREHQVYIRRPFIDIHRMGLRWCAIFMSLLGDEGDLNTATRFITNHPSVGWFSELHGSFSIGIALAINHPKQVDTFLKELIRESDVRIYKKSIAFRLAIMDCPRQYLAPHAANRATHFIEDGVQGVITDSSDEAILQALTELPESSTREIGAHLGMPHTTVDLRLRKLRANRVLLGHSLHIVPEKLGRQLHKLLVFTHDKSEKLSLGMRRFAVKHPDVSHFVENIGEWDFEFNVEVRSLEDLRKFEYSLRAEFDSKIHDIVTLGLSKLYSLRRIAVVNPLTR